MSLAKIVGCFASVLFSVLICTAQTVTPNGGKIEGEIHTPSGLPIAHATVRLLPPRAAGNFPTENVAMALSNDDGRFTIPNVPEGDGYILSISCSGYLGTRYSASGIDGLATPIAIHSGSDRLRVRIVLIPQGVISGKVVDQQGDPVIGVQVLAMSRPPVVPSSRLPTILSSTTNGRGEFRFTDLREGEYYLRSESTPGVFMTRVSSHVQNLPSSDEPVNVPTFFPSALDDASAATLHVAPGLELSENTIVLRRERVFSVSGVVIESSSGKPVPGVEIQTSGPRGFNTQESISDENGTFVFPQLLPGTYTLLSSDSARSDAPIGTILHKEVSVRDSNLSDVQLLYQPGGLVTGKVTIEGGSPATSEDVTTVRLMERINATDGRRIEASVNQDGTFEMRLSPSAYAFMVVIRRNNKNFFFTGVKVDGSDVGRSSKINIPPGAGHTLEFVLSPGGAKLSGAVTDDKGRPVSGLPVGAVPKILNESSLTYGASFATSDQNGRFELLGLAPNTYYVAVINHLNEITSIEGMVKSIGQQSAGRVEIKLSRDSIEDVPLKVTP